MKNGLFDRGAAVLAHATERHSLLASATVSHVLRAAQARGFDVAYYRDGELEAAVVLVTPEGAVPVVIHDRDDVGEEEAERVERIMRRTKAKSAFLLSRSGPRRKASVTFFETIYHLPAAYFLYALEG